MGALADTTTMDVAPVRSDSFGRCRLGEVFRYGKARSRLIASGFDERFPFGAVGADALAVELVSGEMCHFVTKDFFEKSKLCGLEASCESHFALAGIATPQAAR